MIINLIIFVYVAQVVLAVFLFVKDAHGNVNTKHYATKSAFYRDLNPLMPYKLLYNKFIKPVINHHDNL